MDYLAGFLTDLIGDAEIANWMMMAIVGLALFMFAMAIMLLLSSAVNPMRRRMRAIAGMKKQTIAKPERVSSSLENLSPVLLPKSDKELSRIRAKLNQAGFRQQNAVMNFFAIKTLLAIVLPAIILISAPFFSSLSIREVGFYAMISAGVGVFGPNFILEKILSSRQDAIRKGFPDTLDLLVVCIEAGLGFDLAIRRISNEMQHSNPILAQEFSLISAEIRAGVDRVKALKNFADRTGMDEIQGFVALLSQSIKFGTSIGDTLRIYSEDFRDKRTQKAEEMAAKVSTKMIFPMVLCFFPSFFVIAGGPIILKVMDVLQ